MSHQAIRRVFRRRLFVSYSGMPDTLILEDVGLRHGAARIDFLIVNGFLHGFELKGSSDSLGRLRRQAPIYASVLDRITVVVPDRDASKAIGTIPIWWGVESVCQTRDDNFTFSEARCCQNNPSVEKSAIAKLLWRAEALEVLEELNASTGLRSARRREIYSRLAHCASLTLIREKVRHYLRRRIAAQAAKQ